MTCSLPVLEYADELQSGEEKTYRALVLSNLVAIHQKDRNRATVGILWCSKCRVRQPEPE